MLESASSFYWAHKAELMHMVRDKEEDGKWQASESLHIHYFIWYSHQLCDVARVAIIISSLQTGKWTQVKS